MTNTRTACLPEIDTDEKDIRMDRLPDHGAFSQRFLDTVPLGRPGEPEDIAHAVAFLATGRASYITGTILDVNGGRFMG